MNPVIAFILGLLVGWLVEWIIDWLYWRKRIDQNHQAVLACEKRKKELEDELELLKAEKEALKQAQVLPRVEDQPVVSEPTVPDKLQKIKGIGPVIEKKLNEAGVFTFEQLAEKDAQYLRDVLGDVIERLADEAALIEQAKQFAQEKTNKAG